MQTPSTKKDKSTLQPQRKLNQKWTKDCLPGEIAEVEKRLLANADLFLLLDKIIEQKLEVVRRERIAKASYDKAAWSEFQADCNATERTYEEVRSYLKITKET